MTTKQQSLSALDETILASLERAGAEGLTRGLLYTALVRESGYEGKADRLSDRLSRLEKMGRVGRAARQPNESGVRWTFVPEFESMVAGKTTTAAPVQLTQQALPVGTAVRVPSFADLAPRTDASAAPAPRTPVSGTVTRVAGASATVATASGRRYVGTATIEPVEGENLYHLDALIDPKTALLVTALQKRFGCTIAQAVAFALREGALTVAEKYGRNGGISPSQMLIPA